MDDSNVNKIIKTIGISTGVLAVILIAGAAFLAYQRYFQVKLTKLQIKQISENLGIPDQSNFEIKIPKVASVSFG